MSWLFAQILLCLLVSGLLGLSLGWLVWGRGERPEPAVLPGTGRADAAALDASNARILELERDLADCRARASASPTEASRTAVEAHRLAPTPSTGFQDVGTGHYGLFGPTADAPIDDLTRIPGIGPVLERQLAGIGLLTYRQIAALDDEAILQVQEATGWAPGRIEREGWVEQSARLHRETYDTAP